MFAWLVSLFSPKPKLSEADLIRKLRTEIALELEANSVPKATEVKDDNGMLTVTDWNHAYAQAKRALLPPEISGAMTDDEVVKTWVERYNYEHEAPRFVMVHSTIDAENRITMKFDWNDAFIRQLQRLGIKGDTEEKMIENYLAMKKGRIDAEFLDEDEVDGDEQPAAEGKPPSEEEIERELDNMDPETLRRLSRTIRRRSQPKGPRKRNFG